MRFRSSRRRDGTERLERLRIDRVGRTSLPQRVEPPGVREHAGVGGVEGIAAGDRHARGQRACRSRRTRKRPALRFGGEFGGAHEARAMRDARVGETVRLHEAVAVEGVACSARRHVRRGPARCDKRCREAPPGYVPSTASASQAMSWPSKPRSGVRRGCRGAGAGARSPEPAARAHERGRGGSARRRVKKESGGVPWLSSSGG